MLFVSLYSCFSGPHRLPRTFLGVDRAEEAEALFHLGLQGVVQQHGVVLEVPYCNSVGSPKEVDIVKSVLRDFGLVAIENVTYIVPGIAFIASRWPVIAVCCSVVSEGNDKC